MEGQTSEAYHGKIPSARPTKCFLLLSEGFPYYENPKQVSATINCGRIHDMGIHDMGIHEVGMVIFFQRKPPNLRSVLSKRPPM
jgi:hypothetical protein